MSNEEAPDPGSVQLLQQHRPGLAAGDYQIRVEQVVTIKGHATPIDPFKAEMNFTVAGERFELKPTVVHSVFPPDGNLGDHSTVFPHIILNRSTLPWERMVETQATGVPWMALLLFDEDEKPKSKNFTLGELKKPSVEKFPSLELESGQRDEDQVTVIDVPASRLKTIMPAADELALLAHVRFGINSQPKSNPEELAIIISNRLPRPGKTSFACLVSVEKRFKRVGGKYEFDYQDAVGNELIRLVSLKNWSFACESEKKDFQQLLLAVNKTSDKPGTSATLSLPHGTSDEDALLSRGYVLLPHYFRHGDQTASWFHGPLIPGENTYREIDLPVRSADELLRYDPSLSMFDISYAAAWQLGRLLALQDKSVSTSLYQWKRQRAQSLAQERQWVPGMPFQKKTTPPADLPESVLSWFDSLRKLEGVPFNYLVPDERMLPPESIRFFRVDQPWLNCLADGALSIGRVATSDHAADKLYANESAAPGLGESLTGFLLRSEVVSGWPGLKVDGYTERNKREGEIPLKVVRMERLEGGVLICLFRGEIGRVEIYLKAETLHFALKKDKSNYYKKLRNPESGKPLDKIVTLNSDHWRSDRIINVPALSELLNTSTSAQLALQMVEGAEKVIFRSR